MSSVLQKTGVFGCCSCMAYSFHDSAWTPSSLWTAPLPCWESLPVEDARFIPNHITLLHCYLTWELKHFTHCPDSFWNWGCKIFSTDDCFCSSKMTTLPHGKYYAVKRVSKKHIVAKRQEEHMLFEKKILKAVQCEFIVRYQRYVDCSVLNPSVERRAPENVFCSRCF